MHVCIVDLVVVPSTVPARIATSAASTRVVVDIRIVVNLRYIDVGYPRIGDVDAVEIAAAHSVPRNERLTEAQWAPSVAIATTESNSKTPSRASEPRNQRGRVVRASIDRARRPSPIVVVIDPASVVERSVTPRLVFNPGP